ncbi:LysR family transcriptional regulator [Erwinia endophytica]|uniref:LysR family transcriptional regulator n=1 Tax=Erwinia endophytica TaxID=1563158 RepID=UPI00126601D7|nr:LysR family transcriptional regulator [Erwinia endophytica]KAB8313480.1 LysR family transcriptional regulator [Erwinia endophytica]
MRLRHIEVFQAIIDTGSISGAARQLNVSQPNVSRVLNHAEQQLGFALFERRSQGMSPTLEAQRLIPEIRELYNRLQAISALTEQLRKGEGQTVRVGAAHAFGQMILAPALVEYRQQYRYVNVELVTEHFQTLCQNLLADQLDFALVFGQQVSGELVSEPLFHSSMVALLPAQTAVSGPVSLDWLCQNNLLMMQQEDPLGHVLHRALRDKGLQPANSLYIKTYSVIADMVLAGGGVGIVDLFTARRYADQLRVVPVAQPLPFEVMLISRRDRPQSQSTLQLKQVIRTRLWELARQCEVQIHVGQ